MKWKKTLWFGIAFVIILAIFWQFEIKRRNRKAFINTEQSRLLYGIDSISDFKIDSPGSPVELAKDSTGKWFVIEPFYYPANQSEVNRVAKTALDARFIAVIADSANPVNFRITPDYWVKFSTQGKAFYLGAESPTSSGLYAKIEDDPRILLVPVDLRKAIDKKPADFSDNKIFPEIDRSELDSVVIERCYPRIVLVRKGFQWWLKSPVDAVASNGYVRTYLDEIFETKAQGFIAENHSQSILKELKAEKFACISAYLTEGSSLKFTIFAQSPIDTLNPKLFASISGKEPLFNISPDIWFLLNRTADNLRERTICKVYDVERFVIKGIAGFKIEGIKDERKWRIFMKDPTGLLDSTGGDWKNIDNFLINFSSALAKEFMYDDEFKPSGWQFEFYGNGESTIVLFGKVIEDYVQLKIEGRDEYYLVQKGKLLQWCEPDIEKFKSYQMLLGFEAHPVKKMEITIYGDIYTFIRNKSGWFVKNNGKTIEIAVNLGVNAVNNIVHLEYGGISTGQINWDEQERAMRVDFEYFNESKFFIEIRHSLDGGYYAKASERDEIFIVRPDMVSTIKKKLGEILDIKE